MDNMIVAQDSEHSAFLNTDDNTVAVFRKAGGVLLGTGRWEDGIVRGSGVNCGILVRLEPELRAKTETA